MCISYGWHSLGCQQEQGPQWGELQIGGFSFCHLSLFSFLVSLGFENGILSLLGRKTYSHDSERPDVHFLRVVIATNELGGHPVRCSHHTVSHFTCLGQLGSISKISCNDGLMNEWMVGRRVLIAYLISLAR